MATMPKAAAENIARPSTDPAVKAALLLVVVGLVPEADEEAALGLMEAPDAAEVTAAELEAGILLDGAAVTLGAGALA